MRNLLHDPQSDVPLFHYSVGYCNPGLLSRRLLSSLRAEWESFVSSLLGLFARHFYFQECSPIGQGIQAQLFISA